MRAIFIFNTLCFFYQIGGQGIPGRPGMEGQTGEKGEKGDAGRPGDSGPQGPRGKSHLHLNFQRKHKFINILRQKIF